jgi:hypothetical protein
MHYTSNPIIKHKAGLLNLAEELGNVSKVCKCWTYLSTNVHRYIQQSAKLYTTKTPITAADMLNDKVLPYFEAHQLPMLRILTDRGTEYCGRVEHHDY